MTSLFDDQGRLPAIRNSWQRCLMNYRLEPDQVPDPDVLTHAEFTVARAPTEELVAVAGGELDRLFRQLAEHVHLLMLADANGTLMMLRTDASLEADCRSARILPGSIWSEQSQGTNGVGLCIREQASVSVVMEDHFATRLAGLSCTVAPIFGRGGSLAAVLNVTSLRNSSRSVHAIARQVVESSARRIENRAFDVRCAGQIVLRVSPYDDFCDPAGEARVALDDSGRVTDATPAALRLLGAEHGLVGRRLPGVDGADELGRLLRCANPALDIRSGRISVRLADTSGQLSHGERRARAPVADRSAIEGPKPATGEASPGLEEIAGSDPQTVDRLRTAGRLFGRGVPILLQGESGTGKTILAKALHDAGPWRAGQFVAINCAAIPAELIESELFGYRPGAFTGASRNGSRGRLLQADGGTLFLDEIGDMPLALQSRLLQVLSDKEFVPVGATEPVRVNFGLVSASLRDIGGLVRERRFREDLYYRIQGASLELVPLREREDLDHLVDLAFQRAANEAGIALPRLTGELRRALARYAWPGNIRELQHVARYALAVCDEPLLDACRLPPHLRSEDCAAARACAERRMAPRSDRSAEAIEAALMRTEWNVTAAAERLGISRATLHRRMRELGIVRPAGR